MKGYVPVFILSMFLSGCGGSRSVIKGEIPTTLTSAMDETTIGRPLKGLLIEDMWSKSEHDVVRMLGAPTERFEENGYVTIVYLDAYCATRGGIIGARGYEEFRSGGMSYSVSFKELKMVRQSIRALDSSDIREYVSRGIGRCVELG